MPTLKNIFLFIILFFIIYFDPVPIGPATWAQLWKTLFIFITFLFIIYKNISSQRIWLLYVFFAFKYLVSDSILNYPVSTISIFIKNLFFPISLALFLNHSFFRNAKNILSAIQFFSIFIVLSSIPFLFEFLPSLNEGYSLKSFTTEDIKGFVGLFQKPHGAASTMAFSFISLVFLTSITKSKYWRVIYLTLITLNLYLLFSTYVRTGMLMVLVGLISFSFYKRNLRKIFILIPILLVGAFFVYMMISNNETLLMRITGQSIYKEDDEYTLDDASSGRFRIWESSLYSWTENKDVIEILFGIGEDELLARNERNSGLRAFAHNGFINIIITNGVIGFIIFFSFLTTWIKLIKSRIKTTNIISNYERYLLAILLQYFVFMIFQGGHLIYDGIFIALSIALCNHFSLIKN